MENPVFDVLHYTSLSETDKAVYMSEFQRLSSLAYIANNKESVKKELKALENDKSIEKARKEKERQELLALADKFRAEVLEFGNDILTTSDYELLVLQEFTFDITFKCKNIKTHTEGSRKTTSSVEYIKQASKKGLLKRCYTFISKNKKGVETKHVDFPYMPVFVGKSKDGKDIFNYKITVISIENGVKSEEEFLLVARQNKNDDTIKKQLENLLNITL